MEGVQPESRRPRLERLKIALVQRDWMGILIEIGVVTLGVLLAFQVDQWGALWQRKEEERQFLERIYRENGQSIRELKEIVPTHERSARELGAALRSRDNQVELQRYASTPGFGCGAATQSSSGFSDSAYQEMLESGRLAVVGDLALRDQLRSLAASHAASVRERDFATQLVQVLLPDLNEYYRLALRSGPELHCQMDWPALVRDDRAVNAIALGYRVQQILARSRGKALQVAEQTQRKLACALKKADCSN
jgi:hypothetical protein